MNWTNDDARKLRRFLNSDTGKKMTELVKKQEPVLDARDIEGRALQAAAFQQRRTDTDFIKTLRDFEDAEQETKPSYIDVAKLDVQE